MKILVCGGRNFTDKERLDNCLEKIDDNLGITSIVHGAARGADKLAGEWGIRNKKKVFGIAPDWVTHGKAAGVIRNQAMLDTHQDIKMVVVFPGGRGTADMERRARAKGIDVILG